MVEQLDAEQLNRVWSPILSPLVWDLGHIANFEELWLVQRVAGRSPLDGSLGDLYDAIAQPRRVRGELPILSPAKVFPYMEEVRERALEALEAVEISGESDDPLLADGFVYKMVIAHEHQHNETILQLLQQVPGYEPPLPPEVPDPLGPESGRSEMVLCPGGSFEVGSAGEGFSYDNERPAHRMHLEPFLIDRFPVTNRDFAAYLAESDVEPPLYWKRDGDGAWFRERFGRSEELDGDAPVIHVDFESAAGFARWAGKRLPSEPEWEMAAQGSDSEPANLDHERWDTAPVGSIPESHSDLGLEQMVGDVWEWTSSAFEPYPGFEAFPYPEYSEAHFGSEYRVLKGGSWATRRSSIRTTFRNWDLPERRQIFAGFRCARDVA